MKVPVYTKLLQAQDALLKGKVGVIPTDTVYGLVTRATDEQAVKKMYDLKKRDSKPGTLLAATIDQLVELGLKRRYLTAVEQYWPNPISIVIPTGPVLPYLHLGKYSLAVRIPDNKELNDLLRETGPLVSSSANQPGKEPAQNITEAQNYFSDTVDFYVNGGDLKHQPSTIIRIVDDAVEVLREGAVKINEETGKILT